MGDLREQHQNIYIIICKTDSRGSLMNDTGDLKPVPCDNLEGWGGEVRSGGGDTCMGTHVCLWPSHVDIWQRPSQYCKVIILQLNKFLKVSGKESTCNAGDLGSIPGSGKLPGEGNGNPLWYSCLEKEPGGL